MFLEFFVWSAWYNMVAVYMAHHGMNDLTFWPFTVNPIAAIIAPFFLGLIADRYFATEKVLGWLHILGAVTMFFVPQATSSPVLFIGLLLLYNLFYMPTLGLANSLAFHHITNQEKQFPLIRVFGTIGWIVAGLLTSFVLSRFVVGGIAEQTSAPLYMTAVASLVLGIFSFTLPHTPPPAKGEAVSVRSILGIDALKELGSRSFYVFIISSLLICIPLAAYYNYTQLYLGVAGVTKITATLSIGQMGEAVLILLMPLLFVRLGVKWMLLLGMGSWVLRYALFALAAPSAVFWMIVVGIALHGFCYDFFFVTGQIYVDKKSSPAIRGQAQGFLVFVTYGVGMVIGAQVAGWVYNGFLGTGPGLTLQQWETFWWIPAAFAAAVAIFFGLTFYDRVDPRAERAPDVTVPAATAEPGL
jgi:nucleoside transporter